MSSVSYAVIIVDWDGVVDTQGNVNWLLLDHRSLHGDQDAMNRIWADAGDYPPDLRERVQRTLIDWGLKTVTCHFCHRPAPEVSAHWHGGAMGWVGDDCCWDERLRTTQ